jgi:hypothetical protein
VRLGTTAVVRLEGALAHVNVSDTAMVLREGPPNGFSRFGRPSRRSELGARNHRNEPGRGHRPYQRTARPTRGSNTAPPTRRAPDRPRPQPVDNFLFGRHRRC